MKLIFLFFILAILVGCGGPGKYDDFANCLTDNGAIMYGTDWCSHCKDQKAMFGKSFDNVNFINCDKSKIACDSAGIRGYPTWIIDGESYSGVQPLVKLSSLTGCVLPYNEI